MYGNNTQYGKAISKKIKLITSIFLMMVFGINIFSIIAIAENPNTISTYYIESRFKLWDNNEKMLDENFAIHILYYNNSNNNSFFYYIQINDNIYNGSSNYMHIENIVMNNNQYINTLIIKVNNETLLSESNIRIIGGVSGDVIKRSVDKFTISLSPLEWTNAERNIFFSVILGAILSIFFGFRLVKKYRSKYGIRIIED